MTQEALKLALEALEEAWYHVGTFQPTEKAIDLYDEARTAIKEALAQTQEPWCMKMNGCKTKCEDCPDEPPKRTEQEPVAMWDGKYQIEFGNLSAYKHGEHSWIPLYTSPQRTWVGLTEDERDHLAGLHLYAVKGQVEAWIEGVDDFAQAIEAKLKEKNCA